jgi:predicted transcriptional regulator
MGQLSQGVRLMQRTLKVPRLMHFALRRKKAVALRERGYSLAEIGKMLHPQVSKQAVAKLLKKEGA